jgi:hypothetical protein
VVAVAVMVVWWLCWWQQQQQQQWESRSSSSSNDDSVIAAWLISYSALWFGDSDNLEVFCNFPMPSRHVLVVPQSKSWPLHSTSFALYWLHNHNVWCHMAHAVIIFWILPMS